MASSGFVPSAGENSLAKSVTRLLQHSILQLCNEHIAYNHTLQVLGVLCMTIDDKQQELVVKVNNTLKRVSQQPVGVPSSNKETNKQTNQQPGPTKEQLAAQAQAASRIAAAVGSFSSFGKSDLQSHGQQAAVLPTTSQVRNGRHASGMAATSVKFVYNGDTAIPSFDTNLSNHHNSVGHRSKQIRLAAEEQGSLRERKNEEQRNDADRVEQKRHGRKQTTPIKVQTVPSGDADNEMEVKIEDGNCYEDAADHRNENVDDYMNEADNGDTEEREIDGRVDDRTPGGNDALQNLPCVRLRPQALLEALRGKTKSTSTPYSAVRQLLARRSMDAEQEEQGIEEVHVKREPDDSPDSVVPLVIAPDSLDDMNFLDSSGNESLQRMDMDGADAGGQMTALNLVRTPRQPPPLKMNGVTTLLPQDLSLNKIYPNFDFLLSTGRSAMSSMGNSTMTVGNSVAGTSKIDALALVNVLNASSAGYISLGVNNPSFKSILPAHYNPFSSSRVMPIPRLTNSRFTVKSKSKKSAMLQPKVKDIILYDDSAPLHAQKGARIEGDFLLDSLNYGSKKKRRKATEDALTADEVSEYLGLSLSPSTLPMRGGEFKCNCGHESTDLLVYMNHTLSTHHVYICHQCGKSFTTKSSLLRHRPIHTGMRRYACSICQKTFYRKDKCKAHIKRHLWTEGQEGGEKVAETKSEAVVVKGMDFVGILPTEPVENHEQERL